MKNKISDKIRQLKKVRTKLGVIESIVKAHFEMEPAMVEIYSIPGKEGDDPPDLIRLLEVSTDTISTGTLESYGFGPTKEVPFPLLIAVVTPTELEDLRAQGFPDGWDLRCAERYLPLSGISENNP